MSSSSACTARMCRANTRPAGLGTTPLVLRSNSFSPEIFQILDTLRGGRWGDAPAGGCAADLPLLDGAEGTA
jgi:hypothetical protein